MIAILTADLINSADYDTVTWMKVLRESLSGWGKPPMDWEIYRGDEFQLRTQPQMALSAAIEIKAQIKTIKGLDVRIGLGLGDETYTGAGITDSNGTAYRRSGRMLEQLKAGKKRMGIDTGDEQLNRILNLAIDLASDFMDSWSTVSAEMTAFILANPGITQSEMAKQLKIKQSAVSQRQTRARYSLVADLLDFYVYIIKDLRS